MCKLYQGIILIPHTYLFVFIRKNFSRIKYVFTSTEGVGDAEGGVKGLLRRGAKPSSFSRLGVHSVRNHMCKYKELLPSSVHLTNFSSFDHILSTIGTLTPLLLFSSFHHLLGTTSSTYLRRSWRKSCLLCRPCPAQHWSCCDSVA